MLFAANFFCTELYFLPLVFLLYFHFINERIVPTLSYLSTIKKQMPVWPVCCPNHNLRYIPNNSLLHIIGNY